MEQWKALKGIIEYGDNYEVSTYGNVRNIITGNILVPEKHTQGYLRVQLYFNKAKKKYFIHRLVALAFIPNPENKPEVNHKSTNKHNNTVDNLEWNTHSENKKHAYDNNLYIRRRGEVIGKAKIKEADVVKIKELKATGIYTHKEIGRMFGLAESTIGAIVTGRSWKHVI